MDILEYLNFNNIQSLKYKTTGFSKIYTMSGPLTCYMHGLQNILYTWRSLCKVQCDLACFVVSLSIFYSRH